MPACKVNLETETELVAATAAGVVLDPPDVARYRARSRTLGDLADRSMS